VTITYTPYNSSTVQLSIPESDRITYYAADEKPVRAEARTYPSTLQFKLLFTQAVEQYRYDAFGRRVLVASHRNCLNESDGECLVSFVRRTVWDGNQELDEIQVPDTVGLYDLDAFTTIFDPSATGVFLGAWLFLMDGRWIAWPAVSVVLVGAYWGMPAIYKTAMAVAIIAYYVSRP